MTEPDDRATYRATKLASEHDLSAFDCGEPSYNEWLQRHAATSVHAGVAAVYVLLEEHATTSRVVGYYAINPT